MDNRLSDVEMILQQRRRELAEAERLWSMQWNISPRPQPRQATNRLLAQVGWWMVELGSALVQRNAELALETQIETNPCP